MLNRAIRPTVALRPLAGVVRYQRDSFAWLIIQTARSRRALISVRGSFRTRKFL